MLDWILRGASAIAACAELGLSLEAVEHTKERDARFRKRYEQATAALTENVFTALYRAAMKGNIAAMKFWLENHSAGGIRRSDNDPDDTNPLQEMTDDELIELAKTQGVDCSN
ncbi:MAG: hypothetical protein WD065_17690 [Planctomycetaceae bacterium]